MILIDIVKLNKRINTLENEVKTLKDKNAELNKILKDKVYKTFMDKMGESKKIEYLTRRNKKLSKDNKELKNNIKD